MTTIDWRIPPSVLHWLSEVPASAPTAVLLRHSVRDYLPPGDAGYALPITAVGATLARELGAIVGDRLQTLHASPLPRCVQTAEALRAGASVDLPIVEDRLLGDPGIFVVDGKRAWSHWVEREHEGVMQHLVSQDFALPGMADPEPAARFLVQHMLAAADGRAGLHVFVTHDSLVTATAARLLGEPLGTDAWPWYLEGAFFWSENGQLTAGYRDRISRSPAADLAQLDERGVIDFARREVARTLGPEIDARFFLAGGAFKALLTGRPPRDLDLWAPSVRDRETLLSVLAARGARRLDARPFADAFAIRDRVVELPHEVAPQTLEERLARFDIALSAVGAEHQPDGEWRAVVHPLAQASVEQRQVLLLKPLVNWKYALATLERMRRYAHELGYSTLPEEEAEIWRVFDSQPDDMKHGMLERFERTALGGYGVLEEVSCRLR
jgi:broad specificity phosphatase PhoE